MILAIDGSKYKGTIDAGKVKAAGYSLVFWRASSGISGLDPSYAGAEKACRDTLPLIPFHTGYNTGSGADQFKTLSVSAGLRGRKWVGLDIEAGPSMSEDRARAFIKAAKDTGLQVLVYGIQSEVGRYADECDLWIAAWGNNQPREPWSWWQYGSARVPGIQSNPTDVNRFNDRLDFDQWLGDDMTDEQVRQIVLDVLGVGSEDSAKDAVDVAKGLAGAVDQDTPTDVRRKQVYDYVKTLENQDGGLADHKHEPGGVQP